MDESPNDGYNLADVQSLLGLPADTDSKTPVRPQAPPQSQTPVTPSAPPSEDADPAANNLLAYLRVRRETASSHTVNNGYVTEPPLPSELAKAISTPTTEEIVSGPRHGIPRFADTALSVSPDVPLPEHSPRAKPRSVSDTAKESHRSSNNDLGQEHGPSYSPVVHRPDSQDGSPRSGTSETSNDAKQHRAASRYMAADSMTQSHASPTESANTAKYEPNEDAGDAEPPMVTVTAQPEEEASFDEYAEGEPSNVPNDIGSESNVAYKDTPSSKSGNAESYEEDGVAGSSITGGGIGGGLAVSGRNVSVYSMHQEEGKEAAVLKLAEGRSLSAHQVNSMATAVAVASPLRTQKANQPSTPSPATMLPSVRADRVLMGLASEDAAAEAAAAAAAAQAVIRQQEKTARKAARKATRELEAQRLAAYDAIERSSPFQHVAAALMSGQEQQGTNDHTIDDSTGNNSNSSSSAGLGNGNTPELSTNSSSGGAIPHINTTPPNAMRQKPEEIMVCLPCLLMDAPLVGRLLQRCALAVTTHGRVLILQRSHASNTLLSNQEKPGITSTSPQLGDKGVNNDPLSGATTPTPTTTTTDNSQGDKPQHRTNHHYRAAVAKAANPRAVFAAQVGAAAGYRPEAPSERAEDLAENAQVTPLAMHRHLRSRSVAASTSVTAQVHGSYNIFLPPAGQSSPGTLDALALQCGRWSALDSSTAAAYSKGAVHGAALQTFHGTILRRRSDSLWLHGVLGGAPYGLWLASLWIWIILTSIAVGQAPSSGASWLLLASAMVLLVATAIKLWQWHRADVKAKTALSSSASRVEHAAEPAAAAATPPNTTTTTTTTTNSSGTASATPSTAASTATNQPTAAPVKPSPSPSSTLTSSAAHRGVRHCDAQTFKVEITSSVTATCVLALVVAIASLEVASTFLALFGALISWSYVVWAYRNQEGSALDAQHPLAQYALIPMGQAWATFCSCSGHSYHSSTSHLSPSKRPAVEVAAEWCAVVQEAPTAGPPTPAAGAAGEVQGEQSTGGSTSNFEVLSWTVMQLTLELAGGNQVVAILDPSADVDCKHEAPQTRAAVPPQMNDRAGANAAQGADNGNITATKSNRRVVEAASLFVELLTNGAEV